MASSMVHSPSTRSPPLTLLKDRFLSIPVPGATGWMKHVAPHNGLTYFHNKTLNLVTTECLLNRGARLEFELKYDEGQQSEKFVSDGMIAQVDHEKETFTRDGYNFDSNKSRGLYWTYLYNYPCHHELPLHAKTEALLVLHLMTLQNLTNHRTLPSTPFSIPEIREYEDFLNSDSDAKLDLPFANTKVIVAIILANYYLHLANPNTTTSERSRLEQLLNIVVTLSCCGMPPNYPRRFLAARREYRRTLQPAQWQSFIDQVKRERVAANVMSGLLLGPSVGFLGMSGLVYLAQFFIITSIGLSLGAIVMGFNSKVDEELAELQQTPIECLEQNDKTLMGTAHAMQQHYSVLLLSVLCFFLTMFTYTAYRIYASISVQKTFTVQSAFSVMATGSLVIMMGVTTIWNRRFLLISAADSSLNV